MTLTLEILLLWLTIISIQRCYSIYNFYTVSWDATASKILNLPNNFHIITGFCRDFEVILSYLLSAKIKSQWDKTVTFYIFYSVSVINSKINHKNENIIIDGVAVWHLGAGPRHLQVSWWMEEVGEWQEWRVQMLLLQQQGDGHQGWRWHSLWGWTSWILGGRDRLPL